MSNSDTVKVFTLLLMLTLIGLVIFLVKDCRGFMAPAPAGIHGRYLSTTYEPTYKAPVPKDSLLKTLEANNILTMSGRQHSYDPPWDSLTYIFGNIPCDTEHIEAYVEFSHRNEADPLSVCCGLMPHQQLMTRIMSG
jgi:hypothetical protein